jgi:hypothetical protein
LPCVVCVVKTEKMPLLGRGKGKQAALVLQAEADPDCDRTV